MNDKNKERKARLAAHRGGQRTPLSRLAAAGILLVAVKILLFVSIMVFFVLVSDFYRKHRQLRLLQAHRYDRISQLAETPAGTRRTSTSTNGAGIGD
jgi:hypothetical protein